VPLAVNCFKSLTNSIRCPFLAEFYSEHLIIKFLYISEIRIFLIFLILISLSLTVIYSLRLFYYLFFTKNISFMPVGWLREKKLMNYSTVLLIFFLIFKGALINWILFYNLEGIYLHIFIKFITYYFHCLHLEKLSTLCISLPDRHMSVTRNYA